MRGAASVVLVSVCFPVACSRSQAERPTRLVDLYKPEVVAVKGEAPPARPRTEWRFDGAPPEGKAAEGKPGRLAATRGWEAGPGIDGLAVREGRLAGKATSTTPILHVERGGQGVDITGKSVKLE